MYRDSTAVTLKKEELKTIIFMLKRGWVPVESVLPEKGKLVECKLSKDIGTGITSKNLYRMKHNGRWNDYDKLVTHWKPILPPTE